MPDLSVPPSESGILLRDTAVRLGLHAADLFVLAALPLPEDLSPVDVRAGYQVKNLVSNAMSLDGPARIHLLNAARAVTAQEHVIEFPPIRYGTSPGAMIRALLFARNLRHITAAPVLKILTGRYVAASVISQIGRDNVRLTGEWLADLSVVLGMPAGLLSAITGLEVAEKSRDQAVLDAAELIWAVRRLTYDQVHSLAVAAASR